MLTETPFSFLSKECAVWLFVNLTLMHRHALDQSFWSDSCTLTDIPHGTLSRWFSLQVDTPDRDRLREVPRVLRCIHVTPVFKSIGCRHWHLRQGWNSALRVLGPFGGCPYSPQSRMFPRNADGHYLCELQVKFLCMPWIRAAYEKKSRQLG